MNRKQHRAAGSPGAPPAFGAGGNTAPGAALADRFAAATARHRAGALGEAEGLYRDILAHFPGHTATHAELGAALVAQGRIGEAIAHFEQVVALRPDLAVAFDPLGKAYMAAGRPELAIDAAGRALDLAETAQRKVFFTQCVKSVRFQADDGRFRRLVLRALTEDWARPRELCGVSISLIKLNRAVGDGIARADAAWPARLPVAELLGAAGMAALAGDRLLWALLVRDPVTDIGLERLLTNVRHVMLTEATEATAADGKSGGAGDENLLDFYCAVARQCFINDYVFATTEAEAEAAARLRARLEQSLAAGASCAALLPVVVGAYFPLHAVANAPVLLERPWPDCVKELLVQQVEEPPQERRIAAAIATLGGGSGGDDAADAVRRQYEESPYPRWVRSAPPAAAAPANEPGTGQSPDVLFAGCGTGLSTVEFAMQAPRARIVAIDLSRASLGYAKRMAQKLGLANIEFAQADIMGLGSLGRQFDLIDSSGVLHHLADPWAGWRILLALLRPGGLMQIGLYSELARRNIVAAQKLIAERGYRPIAPDIWRARQDIVAAADGSLLKSVIQWEDFFTTNECRDLLFHAREQRMTLREIKPFLAANAVQFEGFLLDVPTRQRFAMRFPDPAAMTDLDRWHDFEIEAPRTFAAMYQFLVRKPAAPSPAMTASPNSTG